MDSNDASDATHSSVVDMTVTLIVMTIARWIRWIGVE